MRYYSTVSARITTTRTEGFYPSYTSARYVAAQFVWLFGDSGDWSASALLAAHKAAYPSRTRKFSDSGFTDVYDINQRNALSRMEMILSYLRGEHHSIERIEMIFTTAECRLLREFASWISIDDGAPSNQRALDKAYVACNLNDGRTLVVVSRKDELSDEYIARKFPQERSADR